MAVISQPTLFSWDNMDAHSDMDRLLLVLENLPDEKIVRYLEVIRGNGRDDYPVRAMWNAVLAGVIFQHPSIESLCRELSRNPSLLQACGFNPLPKTFVDETLIPFRSELVVPAPNGYNFSRFLAHVIELEECLGLISGLVVTLRHELMAVLPEYGKHLGYDGKAIQSYSTGRVNQQTQQTSDPDANWGKHTISGTDKQGNPWSKVKSWFGFRLHLIADTATEIPVAQVITDAARGESPILRQMLHQLFEETPQMAERCVDFSADRGLDCGETKALLWDEYQIRPLIDIRQMWREEKEAADFDPEQPILRALDTERADTILYSEKGGVYCRCPQSGTIREMSFHGFESDRETLKYRCPAAVAGVSCQGTERCHQAG